MAPTTSSVFASMADQGGCPKAFSASVAFKARDMVSVGSIVYECKPWPNSSYCNQHVPGSCYSKLGWTVLGHCSGSMAPTASPVTLIGTNCPPLYVSGATYTAGDLVCNGA